MNTPKPDRMPTMQPPSLRQGLGEGACDGVPARFRRRPRGLSRAVPRLMTALVLILPPALACAQDDQPTLDELLDLTAPGEQAPADRSPAESPAELDPAVERMLEQSNPADVLEQALQQMDEVAVRLGRDRDAGLDTQREQESILAKLDQVIAAARQQQSGSSSSGSSGSSSSSPRPADAGGGQMAGQTPPAPGPAGAESQGQMQSAGAAQPSTGEAAPGSPREAQQPQRPIEELRSEWGGLPPRLRDELTEGLSEQFSPIYRDLTEAYYRSLAEQ